MELVLSAAVAAATLAVGVPSPTWLSYVAPAPTDPAASVVVLAPTLVGDAPADVPGAVRDAVVKGFATAGSMTTVPRGAKAKFLGVDGCTGGPCIVDIAKGLDAQLVVRTEVTASDGDYIVKLTGFDGATGDVAIDREATCEICGLGELQQFVEDLAGEIPSALADTDEPTRVGLEIRTDPPGATVFVDGKEQGKTPLDLLVEPASYDIEVRAGAETRKRSVETTVGQRTTVRFDLTPTKKLSRTQKMWRWGWAAVGTGTAVTVTGIVLVLVDNRPFKPRCKGDNVNEDGTCRFRLNSLAAGVTLTVVGVGLLATGTALVAVAARRKKNDQARVWPVLSPTGLGLAGRF